MIKPTLHSCDIPNEFKLRDSRISISIDNINYDPNASLNVFVQVEPPEVRNVIPALIANQHRFDLILAWHPTILENCKTQKDSYLDLVGLTPQSLSLTKQTLLVF
jgi:hypothetical protein